MATFALDSLVDEDGALRPRRSPDHRSRATHARRTFSRQCGFLVENIRRKAGLKHLIFMFFLMLVLAVPGQPQAANPPNFVVIMTDDQGVPEFTKNSMPKTWLHIVSKGANFSNAWYNVSLCCPSRATFLTGKYFHNTGVWRNSYAQFVENGNVPQTVAAVLGTLGVNRLIMAGKHLNGYSGGLPKGWTHWHGRTGGTNIFYDSKVIHYSPTQKGVRETITQYTTDWYFDQAYQDTLNALRANQTFFTFVNVSAPHTPSTPAKRHLASCSSIPLSNSPAYNVRDPGRAAYHRISKFNTDFEAKLTERRKQRLCSLKAVDEGVEKLVKLVESYGKAGNTYFVFLSDNGMAMGTDGGLTNSKGSPGRDSLQMILSLRGPGIGAGITIKHLVSMADLMPTIVALAGGGMPSWVDGRSLKPLWSSSPPALAAFRKALPVGLITSSSTPRIPTWKGVVTYDGRTYAEYPDLLGSGDVWQELFKRQADPHETYNLIAKEPAANVTKWRALAARLATCKAAGCRQADQSALPN